MSGKYRAAKRTDTHASYKHPHIPSENRDGERGWKDNGHTTLKRLAHAKQPSQQCSLIHNTEFPQVSNGCSTTHVTNRSLDVLLPFRTTSSCQSSQTTTNCPSWMMMPTRMNQRNLTAGKVCFVRPLCHLVSGADSIRPNLRVRQLPPQGFEECSHQ